ncbi:cyclic lactone autoinducer peptide [Natranaerobius thermophilus]|uniref:Cyclic lactone autoinducer peptide n=1 Tax=Natranaerobius thermophilus (strain ATCC BAA-1301 / DSM 18059 / JW/NM-WN-LF) TaxID=457570 RepID=B2A277_NATTJ|nr:cyclic lactone autoinducer peptide [Natranaerobius thermophilus]ACB86185.1 hypothetical protein Nther_2630 [Natranaerobius thermophilus JW/NM-WN-LF]
MLKSKILTNVAILLKLVALLGVSTASLGLMHEPKTPSKFTN